MSELSTSSSISELRAAESWPVSAEGGRESMRDNSAILASTSTTDCFSCNTATRASPLYSTDDTQPPPPLKQHTHTETENSTHADRSLYNNLHLSTTIYIHLDVLVKVPTPFTFPYGFNCLPPPPASPISVPLKQHTEIDLCQNTCKSRSPGCAS